MARGGLVDLLHERSEHGNTLPKASFSLAAEAILHAWPLTGLSHTRAKFQSCETP